MRATVTTALEVAGMLLLAVAVGLFYAWAGFALAGSILVAVGVLEGRK